MEGDWETSASLQTRDRQHGAGAPLYLGEGAGLCLVPFGWEGEGKVSKSRGQKQHMKGK